MKVLIIEDEALAAKRLASLIEEINVDIEILEICDSVKKTKSWLQEGTEVDLIFSDIKLGDGLSFDIFKEVKIDCPVVFVTAFDKYAIKSFEVNSIEYILKPFGVQDLRRSINKYHDLYTQNRLNEKVLSNNNLAEIRACLEPSYKQRFFVNGHAAARSIDVDMISCFVYEESVVVLITNEGLKYVVNYSLDALESVLDPASFFRVNRKEIVAYKAILKINVLSKYYLSVDLVGINTENPSAVSKRRIKEFRVWLGA